jgi:uncharacterized protein
MHITGPTPRIVLDTNVVLDWLLFNDGGMTQIAQTIERRQAQWIATPAMWDELERVLAYRALASRNPDVAALHAHWARHVHMIEATPSAAPLRCKDTDDQKFLDLALENHATWLISKDKALLALRKKALLLGLTIAPPQGFVYAV